MTLLIVFAVVIAGVAFVGETLGHSRSPSGAATIITGSGTVTGTPNTVSFQIGVSTTAAQRQCRRLAENNQKTAALEAHAAQERHYEEGPADLGTQHLRQHQLDGTIISFTAEDDLNVTSHDIAKVGSRHRRRGQGGGQRHPAEWHHVLHLKSVEVPRGARARAIRNAHTEATQIARGWRHHGGAIVKVTDEENTINRNRAPLRPVCQCGGTNKVPVQAGSQSINVHVEVVYSLAS